MRLNPFLTFVAFTLIAFVIIWIYVLLANALGLADTLTAPLVWILIHFFTYALFAALFPELYFFQGVGYIFIWQFIAWSITELGWNKLRGSWNMKGWDVVFSAAGFAAGLGLTDIAALVK